MFLFCCKQDEIANQTNSSAIHGATNQQSEMCPSALSYDGAVCRMELQSWRQCLPNADHNGSILVQQDVAQEIENLISALESPFLGASDDCKAAVLPFLCVYFFGLCDSTGKAYRPSSSQCTEISTGVCAREWTIGTSFGIPLPECSSLPDESVLAETCERETQQTTGDVLGPGQTIITKSNVTVLSNFSIQCREDFFYDEEQRICKPACGLISEYPPQATTALDVSTVLSACIGVVCGVTVLAIAAYRWKKM